MFNEPSKTTSEFKEYRSPQLNPYCMNHTLNLPLVAHSLLLFSICMFEAMVRDAAPKLFLRNPHRPAGGTALAIQPFWNSK